MSYSSSMNGFAAQSIKTFPIDLRHKIYSKLSGQDLRVLKITSIFFRDDISSYINGIHSMPNSIEKLKRFSFIIDYYPEGKERSSKINEIITQTREVPTTLEKLELLKSFTKSITKEQVEDVKSDIAYYEYEKIKKMPTSLNTLKALNSVIDFYSHTDNSSRIKRKYIYIGIQRMRDQVLEGTRKLPNTPQNMKPKEEVWDFLSILDSRKWY